MAGWLTERFSVSGSRAAAWVGVTHSLGSLPALSAKYAAGELTFDQVKPLARVATAETDELLADRAVGLVRGTVRTIGATSTAGHLGGGGGTTTRIASSVSGGARRKLLLLGRGKRRRWCHLLDALFKTADDSAIDPETEMYEPLERRMADALVGLASVRLGDYAEAGRATVICHVDVNTLAGLDGEAELDGGPAIAAETARRICCDSRFQIVLEQNGKAIGLGRR